MADWNGLWLKRTRSDLINSVSGEIDGERKTARADCTFSKNSRKHNCKRGMSTAIRIECGFGSFPKNPGRNHSRCHRLNGPQLRHRCGTFLMLIQSNLIENRFPTLFRFRASNSGPGRKSVRIDGKRNGRYWRSQKRFRFARERCGIVRDWEHNDLVGHAHALCHVHVSSTVTLNAFH